MAGVVLLSTRLEKVHWAVSATGWHYALLLRLDQLESPDGWTYFEHPGFKLGIAL
jgi:hypothetical protein